MQLFFEFSYKAYERFGMLISLKRMVMHQSPASPTRANIIRLIMPDCPPNSAPTASNPKNPISPQLIAPIIVKTKAVLSIISKPFCPCK